MRPRHGAFGYHLWLVPEGDALPRLQGIIDGLAEAHDGPVFTPHITLLSPLAGEEPSLIETNRRLSAELAPFDVDLTVAESGKTFFQCVYMRVAENASLSRTRHAAARAFALPADDYMPHLSLYYGDASPDRRATILKTVPDAAKCSFPVESIQLIRADSERPVDWHCVDEAPLGEAASPIPL